MRHTQARPKAPLAERQACLRGAAGVNPLPGPRRSSLFHTAGPRCNERRGGLVFGSVLDGHLQQTLGRAGLLSRPVSVLASLGCGEDRSPNQLIVLPVHVLKAPQSEGFKVRQSGAAVSRTITQSIR